MKIQITCELLPSVGGISVDWYEGLVQLDKDVVKNGSHASLALVKNLQNYGKYTCKASVAPNVTLAASTFLLPEG